MPNECPFAVGDLVRFRPEHHDYRDRWHYAPEVEITKINWTPIGYDRAGEWFIFWANPGGGGCYAYRLEPAGGPW